MGLEWCDIMKNHFFKKLDFANIEYIGFDMDGTLYDEFDFVIQPYRDISNLFYQDEEAFSYLSSRWIEKGSSYNKIFDEAYDMFSHSLKVDIDKNDFIKKSLTIYRNTVPTLKLHNRTKFFLDTFAKKYKLFLISDGNIELQKKKFIALSLDKYFDEENVVFTGIDSKKYEKPKKESLELLNINPSKSIFFGDREKDKEFAHNTSMQFQQVYNMIEVRI